MTLSEHVHISRRFQRSIRIDADLNDPEALTGFICPRSSAEVLVTMASHISQTGQGAFTWTGPYGSGKSSLVIALSGLLHPDHERRKAAAAAVGKETADAVWAGLPPGKNGWVTLPVVGRREAPTKVLGEAIETAGLRKPKGKAGWDETSLVEALTGKAKASKNGGLIVFLDEMGKFLEAAARDGSDVYLFQQLAEASARSGGKLIIVGILHQAFEEYAHRLSREMRDEWSKIQGRFVDLAVNTAGEEQIDLLSRAIETDRKSRDPEWIAKAVAQCVRHQRPGLSANFARSLEECWPLHPIVAALLGPLSRRRFGQNQRSLFGFLNSAEPYGFQDFLRHADDDQLYTPEQLWDYLRVNLEPAILASPDGHRWAMATEAVERCEAIGGTDLHIRLLKTIALLDLFRERSGLVPTFSLLQATLSDQNSETIEAGLNQIQDWAFVIFRKHMNAYAIYAGSDFDIDEAVESVLEDDRGIHFPTLKKLAGLQPVLAKRHYHETGALRWFDVDIAPLNEVVAKASEYTGVDGTVGQFLLTIPTEGEDIETAKKLCRQAARKSDQWDVIVGLSPQAWSITDLARELLAIERVRNERTELQGDAVARREVQARLTALQSQLENELRQAFDNATWHLKHVRAMQLAQSELNVLASDLADDQFKKTPKLHNELLNRTKPSSSAVAAQNALLRRMVTQEGEERLGIDGYPAEGGLFDSLLGTTGLYRKTANGWALAAPQEEEGEDPYRLRPMWDAGIAFLRDNADRTVAVSELYKLWRQPPYGVKEGLLPLLSLAFLLSQSSMIAFYREGIFQARFSDLDVDYLAKDAASIQLRWMDLSDLSRRLLSDMAEVVRDLDESNTLSNLEPIDVARGLIAIFDRLPSWTQRTMRLSSNAIHIRNLFKQANDPNKFLFDDLPTLFGDEFDLSEETNIKAVVDRVREGLTELRDAYPTMLTRLNQTMLAELQVPNASSQSLSELRSRAENIKQLAGDYRLDAFISRLAAYTGSTSDIEGLASLAANKPPRDWVDPDLDRAAIELTDMAQKFVRTETFARVKGRSDKRHSLAVMVGLSGRPSPYLHEFDVADSDREEVDSLIDAVEAALADSHQERRNVILAALAELSARYMEPRPRDENTEDEPRKVV